MTYSKWLGLVAIALTACNPLVKIGDPDGGAGGGAGGGSASGGGTGGGASSSGDALCDRLSAAGTTFYAGQTSCVGTSNTLTRDSDAVATCLANAPQCTSTDRATLDAYASCLISGSHCTSGNENAAVNSFMSCVSTAFAVLSPPCQRALMRLRPAGKRVFITHATFTGNLGGLSGADAKCGSAATAAGLNGTWKAWLSTSTLDAIDRIAEVGPWHDMRDATLFANKAGLAAGPSMGLWYDELGVFLSSDGIWTATGYQGQYNAYLINSPPCGEWTSDSRQDGARIGQVGRSGLAWSSFSGTTCDQDKHLICVEQ